MAIEKAKRGLLRMKTTKTEIESEDQAKFNNLCEVLFKTRCGLCDAVILGDVGEHFNSKAHNDRLLGITPVTVDVGRLEYKFKPKALGGRGVKKMAKSEVKEALPPFCPARRVPETDNLEYDKTVARIRCPRRKRLKNGCAECKDKGVDLGVR